MAVRVGNPVQSDLRMLQPFLRAISMAHATNDVEDGLTGITEKEIADGNIQAKRTRKDRGV